MNVVLYGIANCDTVRKARAWLKAQDIAHVFHDLRKDGLEASRAVTWQQALGWEALINRRGTTWRQLSEAQKAGVTDPDSALALMLASPALIKRPILEAAGSVHLGFKETQYAEIFSR